MNPYEVLLVKPDASRAEVEEAYRDLVQKWQPGRFPDDERLQGIARDRVSQIEEAYRMLVETLPAVNDSAPVNSAFERFAPPSPGSQASLGPQARSAVQPLPLKLIGACSAILVVLVVGVRLYLDSRSPHEPGPVPVVAQNVDIVRSQVTGAADGTADGKPDAAPGASARSGLGEIRVQNRTGELLRIALTAARAHAILLPSLPLASGDDAKLGGLHPDSYSLKVTFPEARRQPVELGPFLVEEVQSSRGVQTDQYEVVLKPPVR